MDSGEQRQDELAYPGAAVGPYSNVVEDGSDVPPYSQFNSGDFYREEDDVCRGVVIAEHDLLGSASTYKDGIADGNFYDEPDESQGKKSTMAGAYAGLFSSSSASGGRAMQMDEQYRLGSAGPISSWGMDLYGGSPQDKLSNYELSNKIDDSSYRLPSCISTAKDHNERFEEKNIPPEPPQDKFFKFEVTTSYCSCSRTPSQIGNDLLDFFEREVTSAITKVRQKKFWMKADVFENASMCTLKVRVYSIRDKGEYAIEFQRRTGDSISFCNTYRKAIQKLSQKSYLTFRKSDEVATTPAAFPSPPAIDFADMRISEADLQPLLEMASMFGAPSLQAEAACSLSKLAEEGERVMKCDAVFQAAGHLLTSTSVEADLPTACLISHLANPSMEASALFASSGLTPKIITKIQTPNTNAHVRLRLEQAVRLVC